MGLIAFEYQGLIFRRGRLFKILRYFQKYQNYVRNHPKLRIHFNCLMNGMLYKQLLKRMICLQFDFNSCCIYIEGAYHTAVFGICQYFGRYIGNLNINGRYSVFQSFKGDGKIQFLIENTTVVVFKQKSDYSIAAIYEKI